MTTTPATNKTPANDFDLFMMPSTQSPPATTTNMFFPSQQPQQMVRPPMFQQAQPMMFPSSSLPPQQNQQFNRPFNVSPILYFEAKNTSYRNPRESSRVSQSILFVD